MAQGRARSDTRFMLGCLRRRLLPAFSLVSSVFVLAVG
jgi:hypothetical protein